MNRITERVEGVKLPRVESIVFLTGDRVLDLSRATTDLGYKPRIGVRKAITRTAEWGRSKDFFKRPVRAMNVSEMGDTQG